MFVQLRKGQSDGEVIMLSNFSRSLLFISSYLPLVASFAVLYLRTSWIISAVLFAFMVLAFTILLIALRYVRGMEPVPLAISSSSRRDDNVLAYFAAYLVPFALAPPKDIYEAISIGIFFVVVGYIYVNSNLIYINPVLNLLGYHLFEVTIGDTPGTKSILSKSRDDVPSELKAVSFSHGLYIEI